MSPQSLSPSELHPAPGFSHITIADPGPTAYIAGQVALDSNFSIVGGDDLKEQTKAAMRGVEIALNAVGATWVDVVRRTIYTLHPTEYEVITEGIEEVQGSSDHPAQTIIGITGLAVPGLLIEIEVTARVPQQ